MARILAIDYGHKRVGLAVTDPLKIIATSLETISPKELLPYLKNYFAKESVEVLVLGTGRFSQSKRGHERSCE